MACTHGNPQFVEKHAGVIMVCIANQERYNGTLTRRSAENTHPWNLHHLGRSPLKQFMLMGGDSVNPDTFQIIQTCEKAAISSKIRRPGLEFERQFGIGRLLKLTYAKSFRRHPW